jgi:hypothetical protein
MKSHNPRVDRIKHQGNPSPKPPPMADQLNNPVHPTNSYIGGVTQAHWRRNPEVAHGVPEFSGINSAENLRNWSLRASWNSPCRGKL